MRSRCVVCPYSTASNSRQRHHFSATPRRSLFSGGDITTSPRRPRRPYTPHAHWCATARRRAPSSRDGVSIRKRQAPGNIDAGRVSRGARTGPAGRTLRRRSGGDHDVLRAGRRLRISPALDHSRLDDPAHPVPPDGGAHRSGDGKGIRRHHPRTMGAAGGLRRGARPAVGQFRDDLRRIRRHLRRRRIDRCPVVDQRADCRHTHRAGGGAGVVSSCGARAAGGVIDARAVHRRWISRCARLVGSGEQLPHPSHARNAGGVGGVGRGTRHHARTMGARVHPELCRRQEDHARQAAARARGRAHRVGADRCDRTGDRRRMCGHAAQGRRAHHRRR